MSDFTLDEAIKIVNKLLYVNLQRYLTKVEIIIIEGAWNKEEYDTIAAQHQYATSYISQDVAPKLWKSLTESLDEKVKKSNFKQVLEKYWSQQSTCRETSSFIESIANKNQNHTVSQINLDLDSINSDSVKHNLGEKQLLVEKKTTNFTSKLDIYVERPPIESICYETIKQPGSLIRIKAPSFMGKTYLVTRILNQLSQENYSTVNLSLELADIRTHFTDINKFLRWFCINLGRELRLGNKLDEYWDEEGMGAKVSSTTYFEEYLLAQSENPLVLCLDNLDLLFPHPQIYEDFFGLLRSWYEKARSRKIWKKLRLIIVHSTDVYIRLNIEQSPFNVGLPIELMEFNREQVINFARQHEVLLDLDKLEKLMELVGGHPYLLELAFAHLKIYPDISLEQILTEATTEAGIYGHHLRKHWLNIQQNLDLAKALKQIVTAQNPVQLKMMLAYQLHSMGLVNISGNKVTLRCNLYREFFGASFSDSDVWKW
ncbi:AAA-like domain-containing protein [Mastigocoleus testarum]|uniref:AAA-like domain-containing protein n=1 Tax=Mastigocoleus testarum TaxID=996925 RepID=UPI00040F04D9|nr:AAA-like domain-containing protein [Mastigocoleus testarum]